MEVPVSCERWCSPRTWRLSEIPRQKIAFALCAGLLFFLLFREVWWLLHTVFNVDEFENLQVIWLWERGVFPFRDYRHSHLPVYNLLIYPVYAWFGTSVELPGLVRLFLSPLVFLTLFLVGYLGYLLTRKVLGGILSVLLLLSSPIVAASLVEMRPDTFALPLTLGGIILLLKYVKRREDGGCLFYSAGLLLGVTLLFSLKGILLIALVVYLFEHYHFHVLGLSFPARLRRAVGFFVLLCAPYLIVMASLLAADLVRVADLGILTTSGMRVLATPWTQEYKQQLCRAFGLANTVTIVWGFLAIWKAWDVRGPGANAGGRFFAAVAGILSLQVLLQPVLVPHFLVFPFMCLSLLAAREFVRRGTRSVLFWPLVALVTSHAFGPGYPSGSRAAQQEAFRGVLSHTDERTPVLDGISGFGTFRPIMGDHINYRPGFYREDFIRDQHLAVAEALKARRIGAVVDDPLTRAAPRRILGLIEENYVPSENPLILIPKRAARPGVSLPDSGPHVREGSDAFRGSSDVP